MPSRRQGPRPGGSEGAGLAGGDAPSRRRCRRRRRRRRRLETEGEEVRGGEGARARAREGRSGRRWGRRRAGGCSCRRRLQASRLRGGRSAERSTAELREAASSPEPRAPSERRGRRGRLAPVSVPGRAAAAAICAVAQRAPSKLRARSPPGGKLPRPPTRVGTGSGRCGWKAGAPHLCALRAPRRRAPLWDFGTHAPPPRRGGGGGWNGGPLPGWSWGSPGNRVHFGYRLGKGGKTCSPASAPEPAEGRRRRPPGDRCTTAPRPGRVSRGRLAERRGGGQVWLRGLGLGEG